MITGLDVGLAIEHAAPLGCGIDCIGDTSWVPWPGSMRDWLSPRYRRIGRPVADALRRAFLVTGEMARPAGATPVDVT